MKKWLVAPVSSIVELQVWLYANVDFILLGFMLALPRHHSEGTRLDWEPPLRSLKVASSLCPDALRWQVVSRVSEVGGTPVSPTVTHGFASQKALGNEWWAWWAMPRVITTSIRLIGRRTTGGCSGKRVLD